MRQAIIITYNNEHTYAANWISKRSEQTSLVVTLENFNNVFDKTNIPKDASLIFVGHSNACGGAATSFFCENCNRYFKFFIKYAS